MAMMMSSIGPSPFLVAIYFVLASSSCVCAMMLGVLTTATTVEETFDGSLNRDNLLHELVIFNDETSNNINSSNNNNNASWKLDDYILQFLLNHQITETVEVKQSLIVAENASTIDQQQGRRRRRQLLDSMTQTTPTRHSNVTFVYPSVCGHVAVQESTSTLLVARALAKAGDTKLAWVMLDSLFDGQAENGLIPKYLYSKRRNVNKTERYITNTSIPNWRLFQPFHHDNNDDDDDDTMNETPQQSLTFQSFQPPSLARTTSLRVSALPLHASIVHDIYLTSPQLSEDLMALERHVHHIYLYHTYLHNAVMRNCHPGNLTTTTNNNNAAAPPPHVLNSGCYNILHPWESLASMTSPIWQLALNATLQTIKSTAWTRSWPLPEHVRQQFPYFDTDSSYNASNFLLECISNATAMNHSCHDSTCDEDMLSSSCPYFAMLDVGYAAALSKSDWDLYQSLQILLERRGTKDVDPNDRGKFWKGCMAQVRVWQEQNKYVLDHLLWNQEKEMFHSRYLTFSNDKTVVNSESKSNSSSLMINATSHAINIATSNDFLASWATVSDTKLQSMATHLMHKHGDDSFDCGDVGLWPRGGCDNNPKHQRVEIDPLINWLVGAGLRRSGEGAIAKYLDESTMQLVCGSRNLPPNATTCSNPFFQAAYLVNNTSRHYGVNSCDTTFMATAALVYDLLVPDKAHHDIPTPPIRYSWVITLIAVELGVAFSIGLSCLFLSWVLKCRLQSNSTNRAVMMMNANGGGGGGGSRYGYLQTNGEGSLGEPFFSARGSYASSSEELNDSSSASLTSNENIESNLQ